MLEPGGVGEESRLADPSLAERRLTATFTNEPAPQVGCAGAASGAPARVQRQ
jgi:hypothetical protein